MFRHLLAVTSIVAAVFATPIPASTPELETGVNRAFQWEKNYLGIESRIELASALNTYWRNFDLRIPRIGPNDEEWLHGELESGNNERVFRASQSPEFALWWLSNRTEYCISTLASILDAQPESNSTEAFYWTKLVLCLDDGSDIARYLELAGLSNGRYDGEFKFSGIGLWHDRVAGVVATSTMVDAFNWEIDAE